MTEFQDKLKDVQEKLQREGFEGWLIYDFKGLNPLAASFLGVRGLVTRRYFYWIPSTGEPEALISAVENPLAHLPGKKLVFRSWQELEAGLKRLLEGKKKIAMEVSPFGRVPEVSRVDGGTLDLVRSFGPEVESSGNLMSYELTDSQKLSQRKAAGLLDKIAELTWDFIRKNKAVTELEVQRFMLQEMEKRDLITASPPIAAFGVHSASPHYEPDQTQLQPGDIVLIDLWAKLKEPKSIYGDITRMAVAASQPTSEQEAIFNVVKAAQEAALQLVKERFWQNKPLFGWEVDQAARDVIEKAGYGPYFVHRLGHNIYEEDHGPGCHNDNLETHDERRLLKGTCCSIEPGIYLPEKFGIRLEYDLILDEQVEITGGIQEKIVSLF